MKNRWLVLLLIVSLTTTSWVVAGISILILYQNTWEQHKKQLVEIAQTQANFLTATRPQQSDLDTLFNAFITTNQNRFPLTSTRELRIAKRSQDQIIFLRPSVDTRQPLASQPIAWQQKWAEPFRKALQGQSGTWVGLDDREHKVLVAYEPVQSLNWAVVTKIDIQEIQAPFVQTGFVTALIAFVINGGVAILVLRMNRPFTQQLQQSNQKLKAEIRERTFQFSQLNEELLKEVAERHKAQQKLRETKDQLDVILQGVADDIVVLDAQGHLVYANQTAARMLGYSSLTLLLQDARKHQLLQTLFKKFEIVDEFGQIFAADRVPSSLGLQEPPTTTTVVRLRLKTTGVERWLIARARPILDDQGNVQMSVIVSQDITARKRVEEALRESEERYRRIVETASEGIWTLDAHNITTFVNQKMALMLGYTVEEMLGRSIFEFMNQDSQTLAAQNLNISSPGISEQYDLKLCCQDGSPLWVIVSTTPTFDASGHYTGALAMMTDITERKQAEAALQESEERFRTVADFTHDWEYWLSPNGEFIYVSPSCETITGYRAEEFFQDATLLFTIIHSDDRDRMTRYLNEHSESHQRYSIDFRILTRQEEIRWINHNCQSVYSKDGRWLGRRASNRDITDRKYAEEALRESEARFRIMADQAPVMIWLQGIDGECTFVNQTWLRFTGRSLEQELGQGWVKNIYPKDREDFWKIYMSALNVRESFRMEYRLRRADGEYRWVLDTGVPRLTASGEFAGYIGCCIDITERKKAEEALHEKQRFIQKIADSMPSILYLYNLIESRYVYVNQEVFKILGYSPEEMIEMGSNVFSTLMHPDDLIRVAEHFKQLDSIPEGDIFEFEYRLKDKKGEWRWLINRETRFTLTSKGKTKQLLGTASDITERKKTQEMLKEMNEQLRSWVTELEQRNQEMVLLREMNEFLQACLCIDEAKKMMGDLLKPLFPGYLGAVFLMTGSKNLVDCVASWGTPLNSDTTFKSDQCWALRRGQIHWGDRHHAGLLCPHIQIHEIPTESLCIPMMAQGETLGLFYLSSSTVEKLTKTKQQLAVTVSEHLALALANLELREKLQNQSIRDPLTGLYNRRYLTL